MCTAHQLVSSANAPPPENTEYVSITTGRIFDYTLKSQFNVVSSLIGLRSHLEENVCAVRIRNTHTHLSMYVPAEASGETPYMKGEATLVG